MRITKAGVHKQAATPSVWPVDATLVCPKCDCEFTLERDDIQGDGAYRVYRSRNLITGGAARPMVRGLCPDCYHDIEIMGPLPGVMPTKPAVVRSRASYKKTLQIQ